MTLMILLSLVALLGGFASACSHEVGFELGNSFGPCPLCRGCHIQTVESHCLLFQDSQSCEHFIQQLEPLRNSRDSGVSSIVGSLIGTLKE